MVKFFGLIPRLADISAEEFHDHYRHPHGTLGARSPGFRGYVQSHQFQSPLLSDGQAVYEAVAEVWFDTVRDGVRMGEDKHYLEHLQPDEPSFVDMDNLKWLYTTEEVILSGPDPDGDAPPAEKWLQGFHLDRPVTIKVLHFAEEVGAAPDAASLGALRHVRCVPHPEAHGADSPAAFAEVHELWWPTAWDFKQGVGEDGLRELANRPGTVTMVATAERFI